MTDLAAPADTLRPPASEVGVLGWLHKNLFSTWYNAVLTLLVAWGAVETLTDTAEAITVERDSATGIRACARVTCRLPLRAQSATSGCVPWRGPWKTSVSKKTCACG